MKRIVVLTSVVLATLLSPAYGANVTVIAEGVFSEYTDPQGLLPFSEPAPETVFTLRFTYDSATTDLFPNQPGFGYYVNPISAISLTVGSHLFGLFDTTDIRVGNDYEDTVAGTFSDAWTTTNNKPGPGDSTAEGFGLSMSSVSPNFPAPPLTSIALTPPEWPSAWTMGTIFYGVTAGAETLASANANITSIAVVPVPTGIWLFGSALGLLGWMKRKTA